MYINFMSSFCKYNSLCNMIIAIITEAMWGVLGRKCQLTRGSWDGKIMVTPPFSPSNHGMGLKQISSMGYGRTFRPLLLPMKGVVTP